MAGPNHLFNSTYTIYSIYTLEQEQCSSGIQVVSTLHNITLQSDPGQVKMREDRA
jgi:hypothetical protein